MPDNTDILLIRWAGVKSANEIAEITGIEPLDVAKRTQEALSAIGPLEASAKRAKLMVMLEGIIAEVDSRKEDASDRNLAGLLNSSRAAIATMLKELRDIEKSSQVDVNAITANQGRVLGQVVDIAISHLREELKARYPTNDNEIDLLLEEGIKIGYTEMESRVSE